MLELKNYQKKSLEKLKQFFERCNTLRPKVAFIDQTERIYHEVPNLADSPYVCIRIPTGGGKTLLACHSLGLAANKYLHTENPVCLWLVPSKAIKDQTLIALQDRNHHYREAIESYFPNLINVLDLQEALSLQRSKILGGPVIIVSTLAALRVSDTDGRKIYETNGALQHHFTGLNRSLFDSLEKNKDGLISYSLANVLGLYHPIVIMDEAHNARTALSFSSLERFHPSCIIEFTATPQTNHDPRLEIFASNVLHHVSAAELKLEDMIKLPINLRTRNDWKEAIGDAVKTQKKLEDLALEEESSGSDYLRPIVLLQAQPRSQTRETFTVEAIEKCLIDDFKIPKEEIAIATGDTKEIENVDLFDNNCKIRFIITVMALSEGWDCSFAYILCSVSEISTPKSVEQILGRILRLPGAKKRFNSDLNCAYAIATSKNFINTAQNLEKALIENGFQAMEAKDFITKYKDSPLFDPDDLFPHVKILITQEPNLSFIDHELKARVSFDNSKNILKIRGVFSQKDKDHLKKCMLSKTDQDEIERVYEISQQQAEGKWSPCQKGEPFAIPLLNIRVGDQLELFEETHFLDYTWKLLDYDHVLTEKEFPSTFISGKKGLIDVSKNGKIEVREIDELREKIALLSEDPNWTLAKLVNWLDQQIPHVDLTWEQANLFIHQTLSGLIENRDLDLNTLVRRRFKLRDALEIKINLHRDEQSKKCFQRMLFTERRNDFVVSADNILNLDENLYAPSWYYEGPFQFSKSYFSKIGELKNEGEEFECACFIDSLSEVKYWVRNLTKGHRSFWLPTSTDKFYPDFIIMLKDGRILVVEYKGADRWSNDDSKEKRAIGDLWAEKGGENCLFIMPKGKDLDAIKAAIQ